MGFHRHLKETTKKRCSMSYHFILSSPRDPAPNDALSWQLKTVDETYHPGDPGDWKGLSPKFYTNLPSSKVTWQWKSTLSNREYIFKWWIFNCYVCLPEGILVKIRKSIAKLHVNICMRFKKKVAHQISPSYGRFFFWPEKNMPDWQVRITAKTHLRLR